MERGRPPLMRHQMPRAQAPAPERREASGPISQEYYEIKTRIHDRLIDLIDLTLLDTLEERP